MILQKKEIEQLESRYRATFINSLAGYRQAVLIGSKSLDSKSNVSIFNSLIHLGANPALWGFICRPDTVQRDTLRNILETNSYTFNYVQTTDFKKAHQTSAKYETSISEFNAVGFTEQKIESIHAPFVQEAVVKIGMQFLEKVEIKLNGTILIIGSIEYIELNENCISNDGFVSLEKENILGCVGLDAYYSPRFLGRLSYAKPEKWTTRI
jgi:flavin reductase (DIM6/NTAB) family NADH-FMN oxidoreductase RutF